MKIMPRLQPSPRAFQNAITSYAVLTVLYVLLVLLVPANQVAERAYHLTNSQYLILRFSLALPSLLMWYAGFYAYAKLQLYSHSIRKTDEGGDFQRLAAGCAWLAWSLPVYQIVSQLLTGIANNHPGFTSTSVIISNYIAMVMPLIGFTIISTASRGLVARGDVRLSLTRARFVVLGFVVGGVLYCYFTFRRFHMLSLSSTNNPYHLPVWLMVLTLAIPYLYGWFLGLLASHELSSFSRQVRGVLYRQSLGLLSTGLVGVIFSLIALQYVQSVIPANPANPLAARLIWLYTFRLLGGVGFILIAFGVSRLKRIEDI